ncbi:carboxymuconolactone decarboxylase family protein [Plantactinospora sp. GCM10030261]|uniref:carboxymuconolactone decarboxylase family protein n=1 Tax=Plantactinospora sp. GCM10030261 TaxID=3273420 RepID=UPI00361A3AB0
MSTPVIPGQDDIRSRLPDPIEVLPELGPVAQGMTKATLNGSIPRTTIGLVQLRAGQLVGSTYHTVRQTENLRKAGETEERITAVASWRDAPYFTGAERIALELLEAVLTPNPSGERVPDELFDRASAHYDDRALWTLTVTIGQICFFIPVALIAKPIPGMPLGKNYRR